MQSIAPWARLRDMPPWARLWDVPPWVRLRGIPPRMSLRGLLPWVLLGALPVLAHLPAVTGWIRYDPIYAVSGLTRGTWTTNGVLPGMPWTDPNAGVTTEALGGFAAHEWLAGRVPWWNPYSGAGLPLVAEGQTPALFLPFILLLALPHGLLLLRLVLMAIAGWSCFALLRRMRLSIMPAMTTAALFELNGTFAWVSHGPTMPVAFLPMVLLGVEAARERFSLAAVAGTAWALLAGFPETAFLDLLLCAVWGAVRLAQAPDRALYGVRACGAVFAGVLIATPAWWPFVEGLPGDFLGSHATPIGTGLRAAGLPLLIFPGLYGAPLGAPGIPGVQDSWVRTGGYCDLMLACLAVVGAVLARREAGLRLALSAWVAIVAARLFRLPPVTMLLGAMPVLRAANLHLYAWPSLSMAACVLAAFALQAWRDGAVRPWRALLAVAGILAVASAWWSWHAVALLWSGSSRYGLALSVSLLSPALALAALAVIAARKPNAARARRLGTALIANAVMLFTLPQLAGTRGRVIDTESIVWLRSHLGMGRVLSLGPLVPNYGALAGVAQIGDNALPSPAPWVDYVRARFDPHTNGVDVDASALQSVAAIRDIVPRYEAAGVTYALTLPGARALSFLPGAVLAHAGTAMDIWALPRGAPYFSAPGCRVEAISRNRARLSCAAPSVLRRLELSWPGWSATVTGREAPIATAGDIFQSVRVPAGDSTVAFHYSPPGLTLALAASAGGVFWCAAALVLRRRHRIAVEPEESPR